MKNGKLLSLILAAALAAGLAIPALAAKYAKDITVYPGVNIYVEDVKLNPTDVNGKPVEVFIYDGTTYLPIRAVSEALGRVVQWDGETDSVYISKSLGDKPSAWLTDMDYFIQNDVYAFGDSCKDNLGVEHKHNLKFSIDNDDNITYKLNGQYLRLSGVLYQEYDYRNYTNKTAVRIYGDGNLLWTGSVAGGAAPVNFDIDVKGVTELKISRPDGSSSHGSLGDLGLWA